MFTRQRPALHDFCRLVQNVEARPKVHVFYLRAAYLGRRDNSVRVTLDREVHSELEPTTRLATRAVNPAKIFQRVIDEKLAGDNLPAFAYYLAGSLEFAGKTEAALKAAEQAVAPEVAAALYRMLERGPALSAAQIAAGIGRDPPVPACVRLMQCWAFDLIQYRARGSVRYHPLRQASIGQLAASARSEGLWHWADALGGASAAREHPLNARLVIESLLARYIEVF